MLTGSDGRVEKFFPACAAAARFLVRVDAAKLVDWMCRGEVRRPSRAGVLVTVAGVAVFLLCLVAAAGARGGFVPLSAPPRGATIVDGEQGGDVCNVRRQISEMSGQCASLDNATWKWALVQITQRGSGGLDEIG